MHGHQNTNFMNQLSFSDFTLHSIVRFIRNDPFWYIRIICNVSLGSLSSLMIVERNFLYVIPCQLPLIFSQKNFWGSSLHKSVGFLPIYFHSICPFPLSVFLLSHFPFPIPHSHFKKSSLLISWSSNSSFCIPSAFLYFIHPIQISPVNSIFQVTAVYGHVNILRNNSHKFHAKMTILTIAF